MTKINNFIEIWMGNWLFDNLFWFSIYPVPSEEPQASSFPASGTGIKSCINCFHKWPKKSVILLVTVNIFNEFD